MKLVDRTYDTTTSTGTGSLTLAGVSRPSFQAFSNGKVYYTITDGTNWECGIGSVSGTTLSRSVLLSSSTGSAISFGAGTKTVYIQPLAACFDSLDLITPPYYKGFETWDASYYGSGVDGDVVISSGTTTLTTSKAYRNLTLSGGTLYANGFLVAVSGTLLLTGGSLSANGDNASGTTAGSGVTAGGTGATAAGTAVVPGNVGTTVAVGAGGSGGDSHTIAGGSVTLLNVPPAICALLTQPYGGAGGAGGSSGGTASGAGGNGGGGGGGGGVLVIAASRVIVQSGTISANGGNGAAGGAGGADTNGGNGGGGGGGGAVYVVTDNYVGTHPAATGGTGGAGGAIGTGSSAAGTAGTAGSSGRVIIYKNSYY